MANDITNCTRNGYKTHQISIQYSKWPYNIQNGVCKILEMTINLPTFSIPKFTQIGILVGKYAIWQPCPRMD
jgi:hypothetical protein